MFLKTRGGFFFVFLLTMLLGIAIAAPIKFML